MSRETQYIGLTDDAKEFVKKAIREESYKMCEGMFGEEVYGSIYHLPPPPGPNKDLILKEEPQVTPWSSGPMIFTHLRSILVKECGQDIDDDTFYFDWVLDPSIKVEYDSKKGHYYV